MCTFSVFKTDLNIIDFFKIKKSAEVDTTGLLIVS